MIFIEPAASKTMKEDATHAYPDECCGFMFGSEDDAGNRTVSYALPVHNSSVENRGRRFKIAPREYLSAEQYALDNDLLLLGVYHSHPDHPAVPSEHDRVAAQPWFSYVIISVSGKNIHSIRSWVLNEQSQFEEETLNSVSIKNNIKL